MKNPNIWHINGTDLHVGTLRTERDVDWRIIRTDGRLGFPFPQHNSRSVVRRYGTTIGWRGAP
jgi:hypothetical protein